jgi:hypothetical protein
VDPQTGKVTCERVLPHTLVFNPAQGPVPRDLYQHHGINRRVLARRHPDEADAIMKLPSFKPDIAFMIDQPAVRSATPTRWTRGRAGTCPRGRTPAAT